MVKSLAKADAFLGNPKIPVRLGAAIFMTSLFASWVVLVLANAANIAERFGTITSFALLAVAAVSALLLNTYFTLGLVACLAGLVVLGNLEACTTGFLIFAAALAVGIACMVHSFRWHAQRAAMRSLADSAEDRIWGRNLLAWEFFIVLAVCYASIMQRPLSQAFGATAKHALDRNHIESLCLSFGLASWLLLLIPILAIGSAHHKVAAALTRCAAVVLSFVALDTETAFFRAFLRAATPNVYDHFQFPDQCVQVCLGVLGLWFTIEACAAAIHQRDKKTLLMVAIWAVFCYTALSFSSEIRTLGERLYSQYHAPAKPQGLISLPL